MRKKGFSLIELMIAVFLLCVVAGPIILLFTKTVQMMTEVSRQRRLAEFLKGTLETICDRHVWAWTPGWRRIDVPQDLGEFVDRVTVGIEDVGTHLRAVTLEVEYRTTVGTRKRERVTTWNAFFPQDMRLGG